MLIFLEAAQILPLCLDIDISKYFESMFLSELQSITTFCI